CLSTPAETGAQAYIYIAVGAMAINIMIAFFSVGLSKEQKQLLILVDNILQIIGSICFMLFLKKVAEFIRRYDLAASAQNVLNIPIATAVLLIVGGVLLLPAPVIGGLLMLFALPVGIVALIMYIVLLGKMRTALTPR